MRVVIFMHCAFLSQNVNTFNGDQTAAVNIGWQLRQKQPVTRQMQPFLVLCVVKTGEKQAYVTG